MPLLYNVELECSQDYVMTFAEHTTKFAGIIIIFHFVVYNESSSHIFTFCNSKERDRTVTKF